MFDEAEEEKKRNLKREGREIEQAASCGGKDGSSKKITLGRGGGEKERKQEEERLDPDSVQVCFVPLQIYFPTKLEKPLAQ